MEAKKLEVPSLELLEAELKKEQYKKNYGRVLRSTVFSLVVVAAAAVLVAVLLPESYRLSAPAGPGQFALFLLTLALAVLVSVAYIMLSYISGLYTVSSDGLRRLCSSLMDFLTGGYIPLPFLPEKIRRVLELLPFASMQNVPLRIYSGDLSGAAMYRAIGLQVFWLVTLVAVGRVLCRGAERKLMIQGG